MHDTLTPFKDALSYTLINLENAIASNDSLELKTSQSASKISSALEKGLSVAFVIDDSASSRITESLWMASLFTAVWYGDVYSVGL
jgi:hypothetical protein